MSDAVLAVLDDIHKALVEGNFDQLSRSVIQLEAAAEALGPVTKAEAERIRAKSLRNEKCLASALNGIQSARARIRDIRRAASGITTYDQKGRTSLVGTSLPSGRRA